MSIAALYDIHGNLPALEAVLADVLDSGAHEIIVGGDVLPGPMPRKCLAHLREVGLPVSFLSGNGEREVLAEEAGRSSPTLPPAVREILRWTAERLGPEDAAFLTGWPRHLTRGLEGLGTALFCHATPANDVDIFTRRTAEDVLLPVFAEVDADLVVCGHTHMQFDRRVGRVRVVNAGSVGMPFGEAAAYWLLLDGGVTLRRTSYDLAEAAARVRATTYPEAADFAAHNILRPPPEESMLAAFRLSEIGTRQGA